MTQALLHEPASQRLTDNMLKLAQIMAKLRAPDGCPWDREQSFKTIAPYTIEEAYEVADAIDRGDMRDLRDELGDLLFQVVFHAQMASEAGHPHVFGNADVRTASEQTNAWEVQKALERADKSQDSSFLSGVAVTLPPLQRAHKLQSRAARANFDWPSVEGVMSKVQEELAEVQDAIRSGDPDHMAEEIGDLLFSVVNLARKLQVDAETALRRTNSKFEARFRSMEQQSATQGNALTALTLKELEKLWQQAKRVEKSTK
jgi:nucleoside triphosphate diphosphatase